MTRCFACRIDVGDGVAGVLYMLEQSIIACKSLLLRIRYHLRVIAPMGT